MLSLITNILYYVLKHGGTNRESAIPFLPRKTTIIWIQLLYPFAAFGLDCPHEISQCNGFGQRGQQVNMIWHSAYLNQDATQLLDNTTDILEDAFSITL